MLPRNAGRDIDGSTAEIQFLTPIHFARFSSVTGRAADILYTVDILVLVIFELPL